MAQGDDQEDRSHGVWSVELMLFLFAVTVAAAVLALAVIRQVGS